MSSQLVDNLADPWEADALGLWSLSVTPAAKRFGEDGLGMAIVARSGAGTDPAPLAQRRFEPPLDLQGVEELRFWLRSSRPGDGSPASPLYLTFEAASGGPTPGPTWRRLLPVRKRETWELHRLWLGDMPVDLRHGVGILRFRSLDPTVAFTAAVDDLIGVTAEPLQDVDIALLARLDRRFRVPVEGAPTEVLALVDLPENPGERALPYILITPWSIQPLGERGASVDIVDNYTTTGAFVRPAPQEIQLEYRVDVFAQARSQKTSVLEGVLGDFAGNPRLVVNGEPLQMTPFAPLPEQAAYLVPPGRTPLFYRVIAGMEVGVRQFRPMAVPTLFTAPGDGKETGEAVTV
jgi:hypothetical protein